MSDTDERRETQRRTFVRARSRADREWLVGQAIGKDAVAAELASQALAGVGQDLVDLAKVSDEALDEARRAIERALGIGGRVIEPAQAPTRVAVEPEPEPVLVEVEVEPTPAPKQPASGRLADVVRGSEPMPAAGMPPTSPWMGTYLGRRLW